MNTYRLNKWKKAKNILCFRPDNLGDVLMTTPALRALKDQRNDRKITLLTSKAGGIITPFVPEIDQTIIFDFPWVKTDKRQTNSKAINQLIENLRQKKFDAAIIFTVFSQNPLPSALISFLSEIPLRLAYCHENPYQLLTDWIADPEPKEFIRHEVQRQLDLVKTIGATTENIKLSLTTPQAARKTLRQKMKANGINTDKPYFILHPGASSIKRRYDPEGFIYAGKKLLNLTDHQVIITGSGEEKKITELITKKIGQNSYNLTNHLNIAEFINLIASSSLIIANNTGPVHIASALGTPIVDLYALTNPQHTPWKVASKVLYFPVKKELSQNLVLPIPPPNAKALDSYDDIVNAAFTLLAKKNNFTSQTKKELSNFNLL